MTSPVSFRGVIGKPSLLYTGKQVYKNNNKCRINKQHLHTTNSLSLEPTTPTPHCQSIKQPRTQQPNTSFSSSMHTPLLFSSQNSLVDNVNQRRELCLEVLQGVPDDSTRHQADTDVIDVVNQLTNSRKVRRMFLCITTEVYKLYAY